MDIFAPLYPVGVLDVDVLAITVQMESPAIGVDNPRSNYRDRRALRPLRLPSAGPRVNGAGGSLHMPPEVPDAVADPIGSHHWLQSDPEEADSGFASAPGFLVRAQNLSAHPETTEDVGPVHVGPVEDFGATA